MPPKQTKIITRRRKFIDVEIPLIRSKIELIGESVKSVENRTIKLDLTRQLKGKSVEATVKIKLENEKPVAYPEKIKLMSYFIRRMIRKRISYVEDSFETPSQESMLLIKPFIITRKRVSRAVRKTLRNKTKNWIEDYIAERKDQEIFGDVLSNKMQKPLSLALKKTYPLSLCEIRILEIVRPLKPEEVPKIKEKPKEEKKHEKIEEGLDQLQEIEEERIKQAEKEIKDTQNKAANIQSSDSTESTNIESSESKDSEPIKPKKTRKKKSEEKKE